MSDLSLFLKKNKIAKSNVMYPATRSLCNENGEPLLWELRAITTVENDKLRDACMIDAPIKGKPNMYQPKLQTSKYIAKMVALSVVYPDLMNAELQDSYGVKTPEDLVKQMIDSPAEFNDLVNTVEQLSGFDVSMEDMVDEAKN